MVAVVKREEMTLGLRNEDDKCRLSFPLVFFFWTKTINRRTPGGTVPVPYHTARGQPR